MPAGRSQGRGVSRPEALSRFRDFAGGYAGVLCDIWGVVHNGLRAWPEACDALFRFRERGGRVVLISNAPRPAASVRAQLDGIGVPRHAYDAIVTSGDLARSMVAERACLPIFHLGPPRDSAIFEGLDVRLVAAEDAGLVVNSGLFDDETETVEDYRDMLAAFRARDLDMICANPDVVVERGDRLLYCAGALADAYEEMGGRVLWAGKPHPPIYERAIAELATVAGRPLDRSAILAIGDSLRTDLAGAERVGLDALFIASGIHAAELVRDEALHVPMLEESFRSAGLAPRAVMDRLVW